MHRTEIALALVGIAVGSMLPEAVVEAQSASRPAEYVVAHSSVLSQGEASLELQLSSGKTVRVTFSHGSVVVERTGPDGNQREVVAQYDVGGQFETAWRELAGRASRADPAEMLAALQQWRMEGLSDAELAALRNTIGPFTELTPASVSPPMTAARLLTGPEIGASDPETDFAAVVGALEGLEGLAALRALESLKALELLEGTEDPQRIKQLEQLGALATLQGLEQLKREQPHPVTELGFGAIALQVINDLLGLIASFIALGALGFGLSFFAPRPLEVVADTVHQSFWRSFMVGLLAIPLVIPVFGMLLVGLALTVIGIVVIPFAIVGFVIAAVLAILGGYIAAARSVGEVYLRRRMSLGHAVGGWLAYRYVVYGLVAIMSVWIPAVLLSWIPLAGTIATTSAIAITSMLATAGFGAAILSRAGIRGTFGRRFDQALTDEYLYHTPQATPIMRTHHRDVHSR
ncbi:MAG: hypothetical protein AMS18_03445 [Gemmatimonas sp. SG8_17]|nr:MAG: hypothetical protein AMS18_03445 [Gemmatimonas sp. SG8_17]